MRLTDFEILTIKKTINNHFGKEAEVYLFGSRIDDKKKGGDIDLLVKAGLQTKEMFKAKLETLCDLQIHLGEQKIDLITVSNNNADNRDLVLAALHEGIKL